MSIPAIVTGGFGNGTFTATIAEVVTRGYISAPPTPFVSNLTSTLTRDLVRTMPYVPTENELTQGD